MYKKRNIVKPILSWYVRHGRSFPWRQISNPYRILVSEVMLQQTQVSRVLAKYPEFLRRFPTLRSLADARQRDVVVAWRGMGYNNRAVRLHKLGRVVMRHHDGRLPKDLDSLLALPGVGKYTANAILSSAFGMSVPVVDINVQRLFSRLFWKQRSTAEMRPEQEIWKIASDILPQKEAYEWNQALMDIGATICTARTPTCAICPVASQCASRTSMKQTPVRRSRNEPSRGGIPNRIHRGRIIEELRNTTLATGARLDVLGNKVLTGFSTRDARWLTALLQGLQRDGLVKISGAGSLTTTRAMLA